MSLPKLGDENFKVVFHCPKCSIPEDYYLYTEDVMRYALTLKCLIHTEISPDIKVFLYTAHHASDTPIYVIGRESLAKEISKIAMDYSNVNLNDMQYLSYDSREVSTMNDKYIENFRVFPLCVNPECVLLEGFRCTKQTMDGVITCPEHGHTVLRTIYQLGSNPRSVDPDFIWLEGEAMSTEEWKKRFSKTLFEDKRATWKLHGIQVKCE